MRLYHYVHCPFCVRVRLAAGFLGLSYESKVLSYADEQTPIALTGTKMLPIMEDRDGVMNESLDIIKKLDNSNLLNIELLDDPKGKEQINQLLDRLGAPIHNLCMPYWIWTPEFDEQSRRYFIEKKSLKRGPFHQLMKNQPKFLASLAPELDALEPMIGPFFNHHSKLTILDIMLASHLWGLTILPEFRFSQKLYDYLMAVKKLCHFDYHQDFKTEETFRTK
jgi:glutaredoxin 2